MNQPDLPLPVKPPRNRSLHIILLSAAPLLIFTWQIMRITDPNAQTGNPATPTGYTIAGLLLGLLGIIALWAGIILRLIWRHRIRKFVTVIKDWTFQKYGYNLYNLSIILGTKGHDRIPGTGSYTSKRIKVNTPTGQHQVVLTTLNKTWILYDLTTQTELLKPAQRSMNARFERFYTELSVLEGAYTIVDIDTDDNDQYCKSVTSSEPGIPPFCVLLWTHKNDVVGTPYFTMGEERFRFLDMQELTLLMKNVISEGGVIGYNWEDAHQDYINPTALAPKLEHLKEEIEYRKLYE